MTGKILFVDDDPNLLAAFQRTLRKRFVFDTALGGAAALALLQTNGPYAVAVVDMRMPGMDGIELLERVRELSPDTVRLMLTGNADQQTAIDAVNRGHVYRFLTKPTPLDILVTAVEAGLEHSERLRVERELLEGTLTGSVKLLTDVLGMVAPEALGRGQRLRDSIARLARHVRSTQPWECELGALLASIGSAALPPSILNKLAAGEPLRPQESEIMRRVPQIGHDLLADIPRLSGVADIVLYQHKRFDGSGFPADSMSGPAIPLGARLLNILNDRLDLEADGVVKRRAFDVMQARKGVYDPELLIACFTCFEDFLVNAVSAELPVLALTVAQLTPGLVVVSDIVIHGGILIVGAGHRLTAAMIQRLRNFAELGELDQHLLVQRPSMVPLLPTLPPVPA